MVDLIPKFQKNLEAISAQLTEIERRLDESVQPEQEKIEIQWDFHARATLFDAMMSSAQGVHPFATVAASAATNVLRARMGASADAIIGEIRLAVDELLSDEIMEAA